MAELSYEVKVQVDDSQVLALERGLSDAADRMQELSRQSAALNAELANAKAAGKPLEELEAKQAALNDEIERGNREISNQASQYEKAGDSGSLSLGKIATTIFTTGIALQLLGRQLSSLERRYQRLGALTGGSVGRQFSDFGQQLSQVTMRLLGLGSAGAAGAAALAGVAIAAGVAAAGIVVYGATMAIAVGRTKAYARELLALERASVSTGESMQDLGETMLAASGQGLSIAPGAFQEFARRRDKAIQDATSREAQAYVQLGVQAGADLSEVRDAVMSVEDDFQRAQLAAQIFGRQLGATVAMMEQVTDEEKRMTSRRLADAEQIKDSARVWFRIGNALKGIGEGITANLSPVVEEFGNALLPILEDIALWARHSPEIRAFADAVMDVTLAIAQGLRLISNVSDEQLDSWRQRDDLRIAEYQLEQEGNADRRRVAALQAAETDKVAQATTAWRTAIDRTDDTLRAILPELVCGAETAAALQPAAAAIPGAMELPEEPAIVRAEKRRQQLEYRQGLIDEEINEQLRLGSRWNTLADVVNPFGGQPPSVGETWRAVTGGPDRPNLVDATMQTIPGPSVAEGYRAAMNFDLFDHLPGWMGGNSAAATMPAISGPSAAANVYQEMNGPESGAAESELLRQLSYEMNSYHDAGDTAYQEAGDTVNNNNVSITYNDRRGAAGRPDMDMVADDLVDAMNRRYAGD